MHVLRIILREYTARSTVVYFYYYNFYFNIQLKLDICITTTYLHNIYYKVYWWQILARMVKIPEHRISGWNFTLYLFYKSWIIRMTKIRITNNIWMPDKIRMAVIRKAGIWMTMTNNNLIANKVNSIQLILTGMNLLPGFYSSSDLTCFIRIW